MQKEDNIAGEMMQERFCAVFWFCIIHVFIQILQNFSQEEENAKSWPQELKQIRFSADHLSTFFLNVRPSYMVWPLKAGHQGCFRIKERH